MTYVVTETCIKCKYTDCVEVCPVEPLPDAQKYKDIKNKREFLD